jgi:hypothetical protein
MEGSKKFQGEAIKKFEAAQSLAHMAKDMAPGIEHHEMAIEVRTEEGRIAITDRQELGAIVVRFPASARLCASMVLRWRWPMRPKAFLSVLMLGGALALGAGAVSADVRILSSPGGEVGSFLKLFELLRESGERIIIDGPCLSACTLVLSTIPKERICVTRRAVLGFHGARLVDREGNEYTVPPSVNTAVTEVYPEPVQRWIARRGGLTRKMITMRAPELYRYYPRCG